MRQSPALAFLSCGRLVSAAVTALIFAGAVGGTSLAVATEFNLGLVEGLVCRDNSTLAYHLGPEETEYEFPSASNPIGGTTTSRAFSVDCIHNGKVVASGNGLMVRALALLLGGYFLACFIPLMFLSGGLLWVLRRVINRER